MSFVYLYERRCFLTLSELCKEYGFTPDGLAELCRLSRRTLELRVKNGRGEDIEDVLQPLAVIESSKQNIERSRKMADRALIKLKGKGGE